jgi:signal transduction histidine kinase
MKRIWLLLLLPFVFGVLLKIILERGWVDNSVLFTRIDLGTLALLLGILLSLLLFIIWGIFLWQEHQFNQEFIQFQATAAEERRQFLQRLDHELKNPLTAIQAGLANLDDSANEPAIDSIKTQTLRLSRLVADLRKLAELETRPIERSPVDLSAMLKEAVEIIQEEPEAAQHSVTRSSSLNQAQQWKCVPSKMMPWSPSRWPTPDQVYQRLKFHLSGRSCIAGAAPAACLEAD